MTQAQREAMELFHYSKTPLTAVESASERASVRTDLHFKPVGLWVSVKGEDDWPSWCKSESFLDIKARYETKVRLSDTANILILSDSHLIDAFTSEYQLEPPPYRGDRSIDWPRVQSQYDGIIIAPYCWARRLSVHTSWYYGWDCASGCIWNASAVESLECTYAPGSAAEVRT